MPKCPVCDCEDFDIQDGLYYCTECCTQSQVIREEGLEEDFAEGVRNVRTIGSAKAQGKRYAEDLGHQWRMVEAFNIILNQQALALTTLGAGLDFQEAVLQIWSRYLKQCEQAFVTSKPKWRPKLCARPYPRDVQVAAGLVVKHRRLALRGPNKVGLVSMSSKNKKRKTVKKHTGTENEAAKESEKTKRRKKKNLLVGPGDQDHSGVEVIREEKVPKSKKEQRASCILKRHYMFSALAHRTFEKVGSKAKAMTSRVVLEDRIEMLTLASILCLALRMTSPTILLSDVSRWIRERHIPYITAYKLLPVDWNVYPYERYHLSSRVAPRVKKLQEAVGRLSRFLGCDKTPVVRVQYVAARYLADMNLPMELMSYVNVVIEQFTNSSPTIKEYVEYCAGLCILFVLKHVFGLDNKTEGKLSALSKEENLKTVGELYFVWCDWQEQMNHVVTHIRTSQPSSLFFCPQECHDVDMIVVYIQSHVLDPCETDKYPNNRLKKRMESLSSVKRNFSRLTKEGHSLPSTTNSLLGPANIFPLQTILHNRMSQIGRRVMDYSRCKIYPHRSTLYWFCHQTAENNVVNLPDSFLVPFYLLQQTLDWTLKEVLTKLRNLEWSVFGIPKRQKHLVNK